MSPPCTGYRRLMQLKRVVFPAPFGPMRPTIWPSSTSKLTPSSAVTPPNRTRTSRQLSIERRDGKPFSVYRGYVHRAGNRPPQVVGVVHPLGQRHVRVLDLSVGNLREQVMNAVEARSLFVVGLDDPPRRLRDVRAIEHGLLGLGVLLPAAATLEVHWAQLPLLERVADAHDESRVLFVVGDRKPVLDEDDPCADEHPFETRDRAEKFLALGLRGEAHDALDADAVVPAAIEQDDLAARGKMGDVPLEIPLRSLAIVRCRERRDTANARVQSLRDALDDAAFSRGVAPFEDDHELQLLVDDPVLQFHQFALESKELPEVALSFGCLDGELSRECSKAVVVGRHLQLFVEAVVDLVAQSVANGALLHVSLGEGEPSRGFGPRETRSRVDSLTRVRHDIVTDSSAPSL